MVDYREKVKEAVSKLLDVVYQSKWNQIQFDTDEEVPFVHVWSAGSNVLVCGWVRGDVPCVCPYIDGDTWSFLECCEKALAATSDDKTPPVN